MGRSDSDYGVRGGVESDGLANDAGVGAKATRPESVAEDGERIGADLLAFVGIEEAAAVGLDAEDVEEVRADQGGLKLLRLGLAAPVEGKSEGDGGEASKDRVLIAIVLVIGKRGGGELEGGVGVDGFGVARIHFGEPGGFLDREGREEDRVD